MLKYNYNLIQFLSIHFRAGPRAHRGPLARRGHRVLALPGVFSLAGSTGVHFARIARTSQEMRGRFRFLAKNAPKMAIFAPKVAIFRPKVAILRALRELRRNCAQSFDFGAKRPKKGHFCSKSGHFSPKSGHFRAHCTDFARSAR